MLLPLPPLLLLLLLLLVKELNKRLTD